MLSFCFYAGLTLINFLDTWQSCCLGIMGLPAKYYLSVIIVNEDYPHAL
jgi:hypothetical protein